MALGLSSICQRKMSFGKFQLVVSSLVAGELLVMFGNTAHVKNVCQSVLLD